MKKKKKSRNLEKSGKVQRQECLFAMGPSDRGTDARLAQADQLLHMLIANASSKLREVELRTSVHAAPAAKAVLDEQGLVVDTRYGDPGCACQCPLLGSRVATPPGVSHAVRRATQPAGARRRCSRSSWA